MVHGWGGWAANSFVVTLSCDTGAGNPTQQSQGHSLKWKHESRKRMTPLCHLSPSASPFFHRLTYSCSTRPLRPCMTHSSPTKAAPPPAPLLPSASTPIHSSSLLSAASARDKWCLQCRGCWCSVAAAGTGHSWLADPR